MSSQTRGVRKQGTVGLVLPTIVFALGIVALSIGIPKELIVRTLAKGGVDTTSKVVSIERGKNKTVLKLGYAVKGTDFSVPYEVDNKIADNQSKWNLPVRYLPADPSVATASFEVDSKTANEYVFAGILELFVGGWVLFSATKQRAKLLANSRKASSNSNVN
jgi:hypothetical protein